MSAQLQVSDLRFLPKPKLVRFTPVFNFHDDMTEKIGSSRKALLKQEQAKALVRKDMAEKMMLNTSSDSEDKPETPGDDLNEQVHPMRRLFPVVPPQPEETLPFDLILSQDDSNIVSSDVSVVTGDEWEEEVWDLSDYPLVVADYRKYSWTIEVYDREHLSGDTVWFRVSYNGRAGYRELEDMEMLEFIEMAITMNPCFCFYVKTKFGDSDDEVSLFEADLIMRVLKTIIQHAEYQDGIEIPTEWELRRKRTFKPQKKEKGCFLSWLFPAAERRSAFVEF
ncbi:hypothetical protein FisN_25Hh157 [Fistulifera solaris]|uniref:Uncharacterized protein n=1 Tax=Fistulifera solaris TaxID=1519565 RepID=A0A1Z5JVW2_FISSO|nr:hypothetical protein FisN_25Hh157 [Fistulifera solaris]|eukprot:GAX18173.1 hypothetical protein FisN_25Hh157 [Fistulifera solaris]